MHALSRHFPVNCLPSPPVWPAPLLQAKGIAVSSLSKPGSIRVLKRPELFRSELHQDRQVVTGQLQGATSGPKRGLNPYKRQRTCNCRRLLYSMHPSIFEQAPCPSASIPCSDLSKLLATYQTVIGSPGLLCLQPPLTGPPNLARPRWRS